MKSTDSYLLTSVAFSHYVEKARWALTRFGCAYVEAKYLPMFHFLPVFLLHGGTQGKADRASSRFSTPVLRAPDGRLLTDSAVIVRYLSDQHAVHGEGLYPTPEVASIEQRVHDRLGPHTRRIVYAMCFRQPALLLRLAEANVGPLQAGAFRLAYPLVKQLLSSRLAIDEQSIERSTKVVLSELEWVSGLLSDGRAYLAGDHFSAADLAFACMAAPCVLPAEYSAAIPTLEELPDDFQAIIRSCRETPAGAHALLMFKTERDHVVTPRLRGAA